MSNKVINTLEFFIGEYGETIEGAGYQAILKMIEKSPDFKPTYSLKTIHQQVQKMLGDANIHKSFLNIKVEYDGSDYEYECYLPNRAVKAKTPKAFLNAVEAYIEAEGNNIREKQAQKNQEGNIRL